MSEDTPHFHAAIDPKCHHEKMHFLVATLGDLEAPYGGFFFLISFLFS